MSMVLAEAMLRIDVGNRGHRRVLKISGPQGRKVFDNMIEKFRTAQIADAVLIWWVQNMVLSMMYMAVDEDVWDKV